MENNTHNKTNKFFCPIHVSCLSHLLTHMYKNNLHFIRCIQTHTHTHTKIWEGNNWYTAVFRVNPPLSKTHLLISFFPLSFQFLFEFSIVVYILKFFIYSEFVYSLNKPLSSCFYHRHPPRKRNEIFRAFS